MHKWENDFSGLYNKPQLTNDNANFHDKILKQKQVWKNSNYFDYEMPNDPLNKPLENKPKLRLYKTFKTTFETEGYLYRHLKQRDRSLLAQFQTGVLPLRIETGRYQLKKDPNTECLRKLNVEERTCSI